MEDFQAAQPFRSDSEDSSPDPHDNELHDIPDMEAMDKAVADFLRQFEKEGCFTPTEVILYQHAQDRRYIPGIIIV